MDDDSPMPPTCGAPSLPSQAVGNMDGMDTTTPPSSDPQPIPCVADYGADLASMVCPKQAPYCVNMTDGYGTCSPYQSL